MFCCVFLEPDSSFGTVMVTYPAQGLVKEHVSNHNPPYSVQLAFWFRKSIAKLHTCEFSRAEG